MNCKEYCVVYVLTELLFRECGGGYMVVKSCYTRNHKQQAPFQIYRQRNTDNAFVPLNEPQTVVP